MFCIATAERKHCHGKRLKRALLCSGIVWTEATSMIHSQGEEPAAWKWEWSGKQKIWATPPDGSITWAGCEDLINNNFTYCQLHFLHHTRLPSQDTKFLAQLLNAAYSIMLSEHGLHICSLFLYYMQWEHTHQIKQCKRRGGGVQQERCAKEIGEDPSPSAPKCKTAHGLEHQSSSVVG